MDREGIPQSGYKKILVKMPIAVHPTQARIWNAIELGKIKGDMSLREIGKIINVPAPQQVKHHLEQLRRMGTIDWKDGNYVFNRK